MFEISLKYLRDRIRADEQYYESSTVNYCTAKKLLEYFAKHPPRSISNKERKRKLETQITMIDRYLPARLKELRELKAEYEHMQKVINALRNN